MIPVFLIWALCLGQDVWFCKAFDYSDWIALISLSLLFVLAQNLFYLSIANLPPPTLAPLAFMTLIYQFIFDLIFFNSQLNALYLTGIILVSMVSGIQLIIFFCC